MDKVLESDLKSIESLGFGTHPCGNNLGEIHISFDKNGVWILWMNNMDSHYRLIHGDPISIEISNKKEIKAYNHNLCSMSIDSDISSINKKTSFIREKITQALIARL